MADDSGSRRPDPRTADTGGERGYAGAGTSYAESVPAGDIEVSVDGGEVTPTGTVDSGDARWLAEDLAESVPGVRAVPNRLRVAHG
jgi:hypothetical protein